MKDNRGTTIEVGSRVCYNLSGEIAMGFVTKITKRIVGHWTTTNKWQPFRLPYIEIIIEYPKLLSGKVSKIRNHKSVMVINEVI